MSRHSPSVLHVIPGLRVGGAENMLAALVTAKRDNPFQQAVVNLLSGGVMAEPIRNAGIPIHDIGIVHPTAFWLAVLRLARLIRDLRPTAIQSWLYYGDFISYWALRLSGRRSSTRLYWGIRCSDMYQSSSWPLRLTIRACAHWSAAPDAVVANSYAGRDLHRKLGYRPRVFLVIPNGFDVERFHPDPAGRAKIRAELGIADAAPVVIHTGRVDPMKDHTSLMEVAARLPKLKFVFVGPGTRDLSAPPNVMTLGLRRDMPSLYAAADFAISTSVSEGFPNFIAEAMACGVPVVATDVGDSRLIVGDTGTIVPARDVTAMAAALSELSMEPIAQHQRRCIMARESIERNFSLDKAVAAFDALHLHGDFTCD
jgi:glycosyltransferase involved in cell wall biosynthesis